MIWESGPWKDDLLANARLLKKAGARRRTARRSFDIERAIFLSAYIMRKLWEARKLSTAWEMRKIPCILHPPKSRVPDCLNWHRIDELYKLEIEKMEALTALDFCHRTIHSYIFIIVEGPRKSISGIFFTSDHSKLRGLWFVSLADVLLLLKETGRDYPSSSRMVRHPKTEEWIVWAGHGEPPKEWTDAESEMIGKSVSKFETGVGKSGRLKG